ncbi:hypothetical protein [Rufibacter immobilis]|nr:hypothetical protein [Rufibacter immobilis]
MNGLDDNYFDEDRRNTTIIIKDKIIRGPGNNIFHQQSFENRIEFKDCVFEVGFMFGPSKFKGSIYFSNCVFKDGIWWQNCEFGEFFVFSKCMLYKSINISAFDCYRFHFDDCVIYDMLVLAEGVIKRSENRTYGRMGGSFSNVKAEHIRLLNNDLGSLSITYHYIGKIEV